MRIQDIITENRHRITESISVVDQDYDLDQIILTLSINGKRVQFAYTDYNEDFDNAERRDVHDQLMRKDWYKGLDHPTKMEILDAAYRAIRGLEPQPYQPTVGLEPMDVGDQLDEQGVAEAAGLYGPFTVTINTGERPKSRTKTKKFRREDDAILWAQDWLEDFSQYVFATAEVTDPDGNVVWTTDEQGVSEGVDVFYNAGETANKKPVGKGTTVKNKITGKVGKAYSWSAVKGVPYLHVKSDDDRYQSPAKDWLVLDEHGVSEGHADQQKTIVKRNGKPVGEIGIDRESSPGAGQYYMKHYVSGTDLSGYDSFEEAMDELRYAIRQGVAEGWGFDQWGHDTWTDAQKEVARKKKNEKQRAQRQQNKDQQNKDQQKSKQQGVAEGWRENLAAAGIAGALATGTPAQAQTQPTQVADPMVATIQIDGETKKLDLSSKGFQDVREAERWLAGFMRQRGIQGWQGKIERGTPGTGRYQRLTIQGAGGLDYIPEVEILDKVKGKGKHASQLPKRGRSIKPGEEQHYLGRKILDWRGYEVWREFLGGQLTYTLFDPETKRSVVSAFGGRYPDNPDSFVVSGLYAAPDNPVKAVEFYRMLIQELGITLISDKTQSPGGQRVWQQLERYPSISVYGFDTRTGEVMNFGSRDAEMWAVPSSAARGRDNRYIANNIRLAATKR